MSTIITDASTGYRRVVGSPNELTDGKPGSYIQPEQLKFIYDPNCHGLYCQTYPEHWDVRIAVAEDRALDRADAERAQTKFDRSAVIPRGQSQLQIETNLRLKPRRTGANFKRWDANEPDSETQRICMIISWRRDRPQRGLSLFDTNTDPLFRSRIDEDPDFYEEVARGDWD